MPRIHGNIDIKDRKFTYKKLSKEFKAWGGHTTGHKTWVTRIHDHASMTNPNWRRLLDKVRKMNDRITWQWMSMNCIDGLQPRDLTMLSVYLWGGVLGTVMTDQQLQRRQALAGGEGGHGFELWRVLYWDHAGGAQQCHLQGLKQFMAFPKCKDVNTLNAHIGEWYKYRNAYGNEIPTGHLLPDDVQERVHDKRDTLISR